MSNVVAVVKSIIGQVVAVSPEGAQRVLVEGDRIYQGEQLVTGAAGAVTLDTGNGRVVDLGRDSQWSGAGLPHATPAHAQAQLSVPSTEDLQKAIAAGLDPTQALAPTAAGPSASTGGSGAAGGGHSFVMLGETGGRVDPNIGFGTANNGQAVGRQQQEQGNNAQNQRGPNHDPRGQDASIRTDEDTPVSGRLRANDPDGNPLRFDLGDAPRNGTVVVNADGTYTYTPGQNFNGSDSFTVVVNDGQGGRDTITVTVGVNPVNDAPVAANDGPVAVTEDTPATGNVLTNDRDADGDALTVTGFTFDGKSYAAGQTATLSGVGSLVINADGSFTFTPAPNYNGPVPGATYTVSDGRLSDTAQLNFGNVSPANDAPVSANQSQTTAEDTPVSGKIVGTDVDQDTLSYALKPGTEPAHGSLVLNPATGEYTYTPSKDYNGTDSFTVVVSDGKGGSVESVVNLNVTPVNDAPETADQSKTTAEDTPVSGQIAATDVDQDSLSFTLKPGAEPTHGTLVLNPATGEYTYTPSKDYNGTDSFTVVVSDGHGGSVESVVTLNVTPVNDAPVTEDQSKTTAEDTPVSGKIAGTDVDQDSLSFTLKPGAEPTHGTLVLNPATGEYTYTPAKDYNGTDSFTVVVSDGKGGSVESVVNLNVTPVNDAPVTADQSKTTAEDTAVNGQIVGSDVDQDSLTFTLKSGSEPKHGTLTLDSATGEYTYTPAKDYNGADSFTVIVSDGQGGSVESVVSINVTPVNDAPVTEDQSKTTAEDTAVSDKIVATDVDQDSLTFTLKSGSEPKHGTLTLDSATGEYTYTPAKDYNGNDSFTVVVSDGQGGSVESVVSINVTPVNDAPETANQSKTTAEDTAVNGQIVGTDVDQDGLTFTLKSGNEPKHGTLTLDPATGVYTYTPAKDYNGNDSFTVVVSDGQGGSVESVVSINVTPVNDAPETTDQSKTTAEDTPVSGKIAATDVDQDTLSYALKSGSEPKHGTLELNPATGEYTYTPSKDYNGTDSFTVVVSDGKGGSVESVVNLNVTPVNDAPVAANDGPFAVTEDTAATGNVLTNDHDVDGDKLTVTGFTFGESSYAAGQTATLQGIGSLVINSDGSFTFTPAKDYNGPVPSATYTVSDGSATDTAQLNFADVTPVDDASVLVADSNSVAEDTPATGNVLSNDSDVDNTLSVDSFSITGVQGSFAAGSTATIAGVGSLVINANGSYTFTPAQDYNGAVPEITYTTNTGSSSTLNISVTPVNDAPVTADQSKTTAEDTPVNGQIVGSDVDQDSLTFTLKSGSEPKHGTLTLDSATGEYTYTPAKDYNGADSFTVVVSDGKGGSVESVVSINVTPINDAPVTADQSKTTAEDTAVKGQIAGTDADQDSLTFTLKSGSEPKHGTLTLDSVTGEYTYTPAKDYNGNDSFTVVVSDGHGGSVESVVSINVTPVNDAPVTEDQSKITAEDTAISDKIVATDVDQDSLTFTLKSGAEPKHGTLTLDSVTGEYTYTPAKDYNGNDSFTVVVSDGHGGSVESVVSINVTPVNDAPVTEDQSKITAEDTAVSDKIVATDVDQDSLTFTLKSGSEPKHGTLTLDPATGEYTYTPAKDYNGADSFTVIVSDGKGGSVESVVSINVTPVNDAPVTEDQTKTTAEDTAVSDKIVATDVDQDSLTFTLKSGNEPKHGTLTLDSATGDYTYTPAKDYNGADSFTVVVSDGQGGSVESVVSINVTPVNDAPVTADQSKTTAEDTAISDKIVATDVDQDSLTFTLKSGNEPKHGTLTLDSATGEYTYTPAKDYNGNDSFTVVVSDGHGSSVESVVSINVTPVNDAPVTEDQSKTTAEDTAVNGQIAGTDADQDSLTFTLKSGSEPKHGTLTLDSATGEYTYTPAKDYNGNDSFTVVVSDGQGGSVESVVSINVTPVNDAPVTEDQTKTTAEDTAISDKIVATDVDQDSLTFTLKSGNEPKHGTLTLDPATGEYTYTPAKDYNGNDSFTVVVSDGHGSSVESVVSINVTPVNDAPVTEDQSKTTAEDTAVSDKIVATDVDQDSLTFTLKSGSEPKHGTLTLDSATGEYTYTPAKDYNGADSFTVVVSDGQGGSVESVVSITVTPVNDDPVTADQSKTTAEDTAVSDKIVATDVDQDSLTFTLKSGSEPKHGTLVLDPATGEYTYTPAKDYNGNDSFTVVVSDGHGGSVESVVSINVTPVNDAPVTEDQSKTTTEDTAVNGQIVGTDVDQDNLTFTLKSGNEPKHGTLTLDSVTGEYTYTPAKDYNGNDSFTVVVSDGHGGSVESVVSINVTPVNDAPETNPATASGNEDSPITVNLSGSDIDGTVDHFVIKSLPANGTLMLNGVALNIGDNVPATGNAASLTFTPNANWNGDTSFQFAAVDNQNLADATPATATIHVEPVNDAPETNPATASGNEDSPITVNLSGSDIDGTVDHFVIQSLPANGTLMLNGVVLNVGDNVPATGNTASLSFIPNANWNGDTSFQFAAVDNQNLADSTPATATIHVEPVNDAPNGADNSITLNEDSSRSFSAADFGFTDVDQGDSLSAVRIDGLPSAGSLSLNGVAVTAGQVIAASQLGGLVFTPAANASGNHYADFTFSVKDSAGAFDSTPNTITLNVTPVNDAPLSADATANIHIGQTYTFGLNDFAFNDSADAANGQLQSLQSVIIKSLPDSGTLWLNGAKVVAGQPVSPSDIASGKLTFVPDAAGSNAHFDFAVQDSGGTANGGADTSATHGFDILVGQMQIPTIDPNGDNNLIGGAGDDVILGDVGGTLTVTQPGTNYNIALIVDTSGSMGDSLAGASTTNYADTRMKLVKDALIKLADQLKGHDGVINIALIGFNSTASLKVSVSDLTDANVNKLVDAIGTSQTQGLQAGGGTDYQEAFGQAVTWFNGQKNGFENVSLFLTDGDPTESTGSGTLMQNTTKAFADLSALSEVRAIGIGTNVNEATLKYFDNTSVTGTGSVTYYKGTTLFDFEGSTALPSGWTGNTDGNGSVSISSGKLQMMDTHVKSGSSTVISSNLTVAQGKTSTFSFDLVKNMMKGDQFTWTLEKQKADGSWGQVDQNTLDSNDNGGTLTTIAVGAGTYRLEFELNDNSDKGKDNNATVTIDNISRNDQVAAPVGQVDIVTQADQLNAALHGGSSSSDLAPSGNDTVHAGSGNDIVFGDSINTDNLPWGVNGNPVKPAELPAGSGVSALSAFLELKNGHVATSEEMYSFIKENHALFNVDGDTRGGSDNLYGGEGNDILYGQGGNDFLFGEGGNDILFGGTGDDQLTGGKGNDILTGGAGADTFIWKAGDTGNDTITDFKAGEGDRIDISDLLPDAAQNDILSYLKVDTTTSTLQVSTTGQVNSGADVTIKLSGVDLTTYGSNPTDIVKQLVAGSDPVVKTEHH